MGSGKSFWANKLADRLGFAAYDLDHAIESRTGMTIAAFFSQYGETAFRRTEAETLRGFAEKDNFVLATGGGTPCFHDNMDWMNAHGTTIWLDESPAVIANRLLPEKSHRPLIRNIPDNELLPFIESINQARAPFYGKALVRTSLDGKDLDGLIHRLKTD